MKTTKFFLMLFFITAFGTTEFFAQTIDATTQTAKPKRKYTKKTDASSAQMGSATSPISSVTDSPKPKRKYTKKTDAAVTSTGSAMQTSTDNNSPKPKRTYTRKADASLTPMVSATTTDNSSTQPKRKYTKKADASVIPTVSATSTTIANSSTKPKRTYTRKVQENSVMPTATAVKPAVQNAPNLEPRNTTIAHNTVKQPYNPANGGTYNNHQILIGPKGGKYYINKNGNKTYIK